MNKQLLIATGTLLLLLCACDTSSKKTIAHAASGPPLGHYSCWAGGYRALYSGGFTLLPDGTYDDGRSGGSGNYAYDASAKQVSFTSGDFEEWEFVALYQDSRQADNGRERLILKEPQYKAAVGKENAGQFQYCYPKSRDENHIATKQ